MKSKHNYFSWVCGISIVVFIFFSYCWKDVKDYYIDHISIPPIEKNEIGILTVKNTNDPFLKDISDTVIVLDIKDGRVKFTFTKYIKFGASRHLTSKIHNFISEFQKIK